MTNHDDGNPFEDMSPEEIEAAIDSALAKVNPEELMEQVREVAHMFEKFPEHAKAEATRPFGAALHAFITEFMPVHNLAIVKMDEDNETPLGLVENTPENVAGLIGHFLGIDGPAFDAESALLNGDSPDVHDGDLEASMAEFEAQFTTRDWDAETVEALGLDE